VGASVVVATTVGASVVGSSVVGQSVVWASVECVSVGHGVVAVGGGVAIIVGAGVGGGGRQICGMLNLQLNSFPALHSRS
jgi:hypothetical protein